MGEAFFWGLVAGSSLVIGGHITTLGNRSLSRAGSRRIPNG
jgi:hypothetical protein